MQEKVCGSFAIYAAVLLAACAHVQVYCDAVYGKSYLWVCALT